VKWNSLLAFHEYCGSRSAVSLGKAIEELAPKADAKAEANKAKKQASDDLDQTVS